ncbi:hypothetical protein RJ639_002195 [Escallonia herrerae]|uniref:FAR1 domain-containing protein n=1 Tax=Escallonia herrerae TaxID=1293975 RepID=A0AA88X8N6_9ASTE|nr:hypothetical protein RJ639_002195 [Escallonia herrerae]
MTNATRVPKKNQMRTSKLLEVGNNELLLKFISNDWVPKIIWNPIAGIKHGNYGRTMEGKRALACARIIQAKVKIVTSEKSVCNKEGFQEIDKCDHLSKVPRAETRTGCLVGMKILFDQKKCQYYLPDFNGEHNHDLHAPTSVH